MVSPEPVDLDEVAALSDARLAAGAEIDRISGELNRFPWPWRWGLHARLARELDVAVAEMDRTQRALRMILRF